jgi:hypothetical protein
MSLSLPCLKKNILKILKIAILVLQINQGRREKDKGREKTKK